MGCSAGNLPVDDSNLVIKAFNLMRAKTGLTDAYFKVYLDKHVPMQAGLGGGSANAATAMHAFNQLMDRPASLEEMVEWSGDIGSDITFFFTTGTAYCTGRGENVISISALPGAPDIKVHIFKPSEGLSTGKVFGALDLENVNPIQPRDLLSLWKTNPLDAATEGGLVNDLEPPAFFCEPSLLRLKRAIEDCSNVRGVMMSGSGTSVYALTAADEPIDGVSSLLKAFPNVRYFECDFVNKGSGVDDWYY